MEQMRRAAISSGNLALGLQQGACDVILTDDDRRRKTSRLIIVRGAANGVHLAFQLLHSPNNQLTLALIKKLNEIVHGITYRTANPDHVPNARSANMTASPDTQDNYLN